MPNWCFTEYDFDFTDNVELGKKVKAAFDEAFSDEWQAQFPELYKTMREDGHFGQKWLGWLVQYCGFNPVPATKEADDFKKAFDFGIQYRGAVESVDLSDEGMLNIRAYSAYVEMPDTLFMILNAVAPEYATAFSFMSEVECDGAVNTNDPDKKDYWYLYANPSKDEIVSVFEEYCTEDGYGYLPETVMELFKNICAAKEVPEDKIKDISTAEQAVEYLKKRDWAYGDKYIVYDLNNPFGEDYMEHIPENAAVRKWVEPDINLGKE